MRILGLPVVDGTAAVRYDYNLQPGAYYLWKFIDITRPDLPYSHRVELYHKLLQQVEQFRMPKGVECHYREHPFPLRVIRFPEEGWLSEYHVPTVATLRSAGDDAVGKMSSWSALPVLSLAELREAIGRLLSRPLPKLLAGIIGGTVAFLSGGLHKGLWVLFLVSALHAIVGNTPDFVRDLPLPQRLGRRVLFFLFPFGVLAACNGILYACGIPGSLVLSPEMVVQGESLGLVVRGFVIAYLIIGEGVGTLEAFERMGYRVPGPIMTIIRVSIAVVKGIQEIVSRELSKKE